MLTSGAEASFKAMPVYKYQACPGDDQKKKDWVRQDPGRASALFRKQEMLQRSVRLCCSAFVQIPATILKRFVSDVCDRRFPNAGEAEKREMIAKGMSLIFLEDTQRIFRTR